MNPCKIGGFDGVFNHGLEEFFNILIYVEFLYGCVVCILDVGALDYCRTMWNIAVSPVYRWQGNGPPVLIIYTVGCSTKPAQLVWGGCRWIDTVFAFIVALVSSLYKVAYVGSPTILLNVDYVNAALILLAETPFVFVIEISDSY